MANGGGGNGGGANTTTQTTTQTTTRRGPAGFRDVFAGARAGVSLAGRRGLLPAALMIVSYLAERIARVGGALDNAKLLDGLEVSTVLIAGGWTAALSGNVNYLSGSSYLRALDEKVGGQALLAIFAVAALLNAAAFLLRHAPQVKKACGTAPTGHLCWGVYVIREVALCSAIFAWALWAVENQLSHFAFRVGTLAPLTPFLAAAVLVCMLFAISLPAPGREAQPPRTLPAPA